MGTLRWVQQVSVYMAISDEIAANSAYKARHVEERGEGRPPRRAPPGGVALGPPRTQECLMLWTIFVILLVLWLFGLVSSYTLGGYIHILLIIAVVVLVINLIQGRRTL
jgi:hypothetical protein